MKIKGNINTFALMLPLLPVFSPVPVRAQAFESQAASVWSQAGVLMQQHMDLRAHHEGGDLDRMNKALAHIIELSRPSVVRITYDDPVAGTSVGTGFIIDSAGLVASNAHVVEHREIGQEVEATLEPGRRLKAVVLAKSERKDLAFLQLMDMGASPVLKLGSSAGLVAGNMLLALGYPKGLPFSASLGIVSGMDRIVDGVFVKSIQTDAAVNPGNSGGPLIAMDGSVIGINTFIMSEGGGYEGLSFAIPVETLKLLLARHRAGKGIESGWLGVTLTTGTARGVMVLDVAPGSPAQKAGLKAGDAIIAIDGFSLTASGDSAVSEMLLRVSDKFPGDTVILDIERGGKSYRAGAVLGALQSGKVNPPQKRQR